MAAAGHKEPNYMGVFWALLVLTLAEVGVFYLHLPKVVMIVCLILMALVKAGLVAAYFMHLALEKRMLALIVVSPLILSAIIIIGLTPDSVFSYPRKPAERWVLPGHEEPAPESTTEPAAPNPEETAPPAQALPADGGPA
ncbi:MAG: cytochrome C oxidase subunit IV family protein [Acidobacteria bacterium]|nr:cytochrome C oxidase subunit IV family protein [Acidobacteriota bacterium]